MSTQLIAIFIVLAIAVGVLFLAWFGLSAAILSSKISDHERCIQALKAMGWQEWPHDNTDPEEHDNA